MSSCLQFCVFFTNSKSFATIDRKQPFRKFLFLLLHKTKKSYDAFCTLHTIFCLIFFFSEFPYYSTRFSRKKNAFDLGSCTVKKVCAFSYQPTFLSVRSFAADATVCYVKVFSFVSQLLLSFVTSRH